VPVDLLEFGFDDLSTSDIFLFNGNFDKSFKCDKNKSEKN
jgi:hypothetical protein